MAVFRYVALDRQGKRHSGVMEAESDRQVRQQLREGALQPLSVVSGGARGGLFCTARQRIKAAELALLTRQLSTLLLAGLPLSEALQAVADQSTQRVVQSVLCAVRAKVVEGFTLACALEAFPAAFPQLYRATVAAGERSGQLGRVMEQLADYTQARQLARQKIQMALIYPVILLVGSLGIVCFLLAYVVPDVVKVFSESGHQLPLLTRVLIACSDAVRGYGLYAAILAVATVVGLRQLLLRPQWRARWHNALLRVPLASPLIRATEAARFASTLAILGRSGEPLVESLDIAASVVGNQAIRLRLQGVARSVREGGSLARGLERSGDVPPMMLHMIASGERSGTLDSMLARAAEQQEQLLASKVGVAVQLFEPAMLVFMGVVVMVIVMAILLPILSLNQLVV
ncbi:type II secretion system inner membrane protein GspF [Pseudomonas fontis]|uniref:General secretion pathway protein F n=1 Tax=Pseudomonas fontis TaxID=2942633 RepID=A0ABT5NQ83_9PSED|nr:type II secretion system inner membrane protein GspF [Pseudomonas fontis]MDD0972850.1 type II secretion system inner membrane protein GspF [Pseudomonas fontis]MDD0990307.1 type II secretion system inner membrane protein GspF [Pseudomonas fontis]